MDTTVVVPKGFAVEGFSASPLVAYTVVEGLGVMLAGFRSHVRIKAADEDREIVFKGDTEFKEWRLVDKRGLEKVDPNPVEVPLHLKATPSMKEMIVEQISRYLSARAQDEGFETLEEALDFDIGAEVDDLQTAAEAAYIASFAPHLGRADNTPSRPGKPAKKAEMAAEEPMPETEVASPGE